MSEDLCTECGVFISPETDVCPVCGAVAENRKEPETPLHQEYPISGFDITTPENYPGY